MKGIEVYIVVILASLVTLGYTGESAKPANGSGSISLDLVAVLSVPNNTAVPKWERASEILPGGLAAVDEINNNPSILDGYHIELVPLMVPMCDPIDGIAEFVELISSQEYNIVGVTGLFCTRLADSISPLAGYEGIDLIQLSGSTAYHPEDDSRSTGRHLFHMLPSSEVYARALIALIEELGWTKIGVIYSQRYHDLYYHKTFEMFSSLVSRVDLPVKIMFSAEVLDSYDVPRVLQDLQTSGTKIVFAFVPPGLGAEIMSRAHLEGLTWPEYAWILIDLEVSDIAIPLHYALENVIVIKLQFDSSIVKNRNALPTDAVAETNYYSSVLYDSIWSLALAMNASLRELNQQNLSLSYYGLGKMELTRIVSNELRQLSFTGTTGHVNFSQRTNGLDIPVGIFLIRNGKSIAIGSFLSSHELTLNTMVLGSVPSDELDRVYVLYPVFLTAILSVSTVLCLLLNTLFLLLFLYYRKEPEVKASSFALSICIFVGSYFVLVSSLWHTVASGIVIPVQENRALSILNCQDASLSFTGLDLLLATLIAKTLRIYHIFNNVGKIGKIWTDKALLLLIFIITSIKITMLIIWNVLDVNHLIEQETLQKNAMPPYYQVVQACYSNHTGIWLLLILSFTGVLFVTLIILAIKTRKIKREDFKDTKKLNALIVAILLDLCIGASLWGVLRLSEESIGSKVVLSVGYLMAAMLIVLFLFVPKVTPSLRRKFRKHVKHVFEFTSKSSSVDAQNTLSTHMQEN